MSLLKFPLVTGLSLSLLPPPPPHILSGISSSMWYCPHQHTGAPSSSSCFSSPSCNTGQFTQLTATAGAGTPGSLAPESVVPTPVLCCTRPRILEMPPSQHQRGTRQTSMTLTMARCLNGLKTQASGMPAPSASYAYKAEPTMPLTRPDYTPLFCFSPPLPHPLPFFICSLKKPFP